MKLELMSKNMVSLMFELAKNDGLAMLLANNDSSPFKTPIPDKTVLINPSDPNAKIHPYPFDLDATLEDGSFLRVYYNSGQFNANGVIMDSEIMFDIIVARSLWLIDSDNGNMSSTDVQSLIRPYEIMGRVLDMVGQRSQNPIIRINFQGWQQLYVNSKFNALRLYGDFMSIET